MIATREEWNEALIRRHGRELHTKFSAGTVAICGLGGLGSNLAIMLARAGVGKLILIDFDRVEVANLNRQQYKASQVGKRKTEALRENLAEIAPYVETSIHTGRLTEENAVPLLEGAAIVCEAFDEAKSKAMLVNLVLTALPRVFLVAASGMAGMESANTIRTRKITDRFYLCGDGVSDSGAGLCLAASRVTLCAAHQAHAVLRLLAGESDA